ncbi:hypothetical protein FQR65_LT18444 [Abscondita terminalis]|nr:hypothetical protein FQR65_LT18444 [Abscondita terminalis]
MTRIFAVLLFTFVLSSASDEDLIDYYEHLITEGIEKSSRYQFPKDARDFLPKNAKPKDFGTYDFVVVGAGSAGAVLANRLSEVGCWRILLLEAGKEGNDFTEIPGMITYAIRSENNWGYNSTPQATCCQMLNGSCPYPRGKSLGGTTTINCLGYARGHKIDYDNWASFGNPEWSYEKVLPFFIKSEKSQIDGEPQYHGHDGYLNVNYPSPPSIKMDAIFDGFKEIGLPMVDLNANHQNGASYNKLNTLNGRRLSTEKKLLDPIRSRPNLMILTESFVEKNHQGSDRIGWRDRISRILMHSGIGPKNHLRSLNIRVMKNLRVGYNMHDHPVVYSIIFQTRISDPQFTFRESIRQYLNGTGLLTIPLNPQALAMFQLNPDNDTVPDFQIEVVPHVIIDGFIGVDPELVTQLMSLNISLSNFALILLHPKTRGRVYLKSNNPYVYPLIDSKCFCDENNEDVEKMYQGILKVLELFETEALKGIGAQLLPVPQCLVHGFNNRDYWMCTIRQAGMNAYHAGGTCSMGPDTRNGAVVDGYARVHGIKRLRVADTSIMPLTISGQMSAPAMMIGDRVADLIKRNYNNDIN